MRRKIFVSGIYGILMMVGGLRSSNKYGNMASFDTENPAPTKSVPLIRLSEMYLIIAECAGLTEANMVYTEFLASGIDDNRIDGK